jgi:rod shape-determining protein MreD
MILTGKIVARIVAIVVVGVLLQLGFFSQVALFHVSPDVLPSLVVVLGLLGGTLTGAVCGFSVGLLLDCLLIAPLGGGSLVLLAVGYVAGLFRERFEIHSPLVPPLLCMALTFFAELGFGAVELMLGLNDAPVSTLVIRDLLLKSIFAFFLGWAIYALLRRVLQPALVEEPTPGRPSRRRRSRRTLRPSRRRRPRMMGA